MMKFDKPQVEISETLTLLLDFKTETHRVMVNCQHHENDQLFQHESKRVFFKL